MKKAKKAARKPAPAKKAAVLKLAKKIATGGTILRGAVDTAKRIGHGLATTDKQIPLAWLVPSPINPRHVVEKVSQDELASSIQAQGVLSPLLVRAHPNARGDARYEILDGGRRFTVLCAIARQKKQDADKVMVPVRVVELDDKAAYLAALSANLARADLHPLDQAEAFAKLVDAKVTTADIAAAVGKTQRFVQLRVKVAKALPKKGKEALAGGKLKISQAEALAAIDDAKILAAVLQKILDGNNWMDESQITREAKWLADAPKRKKEDERRAREIRAAEKAEKRVHQKKRTYPKPAADGSYAWPEAAGFDADPFEGKAITIETRVLEIGDNQAIGAFSYVVDGAPALNYREPLTPKSGLHKEPWKAGEPAFARAVEHIIKHAIQPGAAYNARNRAIASDLIHAMNNGELGHDDKAEELRDRLTNKVTDRLLQVLPPPPEAIAAHAEAAKARQSGLSVKTDKGVAYRLTDGEAKLPCMVAIGPLTFAEGAKIEKLLKAVAEWYAIAAEAKGWKLDPPKGEAEKTPLEKAIDGTPPAPPAKGQDDLEIPAFMRRTPPAKDAA